MGNTINQIPEGNERRFSRTGCVRWVSMMAVGDFGKMSFLKHIQKVVSL